MKHKRLSKKKTINNPIEMNAKFFPPNKLYLIIFYVCVCEVVDKHKNSINYVSDTNFYSKFHVIHFVIMLNVYG